MSKQASLFGYIARTQNSIKFDSKIEISDEDSLTSPSVFKFASSTKKSEITSTSTPLNGTSNENGSSKFKYIPCKRKSESIIEISDGDISRSPIKFCPAAQRTTRSRLHSDDIFAELETSDNKSIETKSNLNIDELYAKYASPSKDNEKKKKELSIEDKLNLDKQLNLNSVYVNAMKKLNDDLKKIENSPKKEVALPTPQTGKGKFKFNMPRSAISSTPMSTSTTTAFTSDVSKEIYQLEKTPVLFDAAVKRNEENAYNNELMTTKETHVAKASNGVNGCVSKMILKEFDEEEENKEYFISKPKKTDLNPLKHENKFKQTTKISKTTSSKATEEISSRNEK